MGLLRWQHRNFGMTSMRCAGIGLEVLVCPAFLPNLVRKITTLRPLETRAEELVEAADPQGREQLRAYLATIRSGR
jgi:hypothetical protein